MAFDPLLAPAGRLMRPAPEVETTTSLSVAARRLRESGLPLLIATEEGRYVGVVDDAALRRSLVQGRSPTDAVGIASRPTITAGETGAAALRAMEEAESGAVVVIDDARRPLGLILSTAFLGVREEPVAPNLVGGMATPLGVYLTTGGVSAGAPRLGLVLTGMSMFALIALGRFAELGVRSLISPRPPIAIDIGLGLLPLVLFVGLFRLTPLAGVHAAEHMTVNAIERGEALVPEVVARMSRVHVRCGTNLAVGASLFLGISQAEWIPYPDVRLLLAIFATMFLWKPLGTWAQLHVTTRPPTLRQVESGIRAGQGLLEAHRTRGTVVPSIPLRLYNSGLLQVMTGSFLAYGLISLIGMALGYDVESL